VAQVETYASTAFEKDHPYGSKINLRKKSALERGTKRLGKPRKCDKLAGFLCGA